MSKEKVIRFDSRKRMLDKASAYLHDIDFFLANITRAVPLLIQVLKTSVDDRMKRNIILLLGGFAKHQVVEPLYEIMCDAEQSEDIRHMASVQLSVTGSFLKDPDGLIARLVTDLSSEDPQLRANAAFALGWEGNQKAAIPLIERLYDRDGSVQQAAVNALSNLRDDRILDLMLERLAHGPAEQKRAILYNLWRFYSRQDQVRQVYRSFLSNEDTELRYDALVLLSTMNEPEQDLDIYLQALADQDTCIRKLALDYLEDLPDSLLEKAANRIRAAVEDESKDVRQAAVRLLRRTGVGKLVSV